MYFWVYLSICSVVFASTSAGKIAINMLGLLLTFNIPELNTN